MPDAYKPVRIEKGRGGRGGPLTIKPTSERNLIYSVTRGGIHPVAARIAQLTAAEAFDGFERSAPFERIAVAVIDSGGTAQVSVYPVSVPTVDVHAISPEEPLPAFIKEDIFVSGVKPENVTKA